MPRQAILIDQTGYALTRYLSTDTITKVAHVCSEHYVYRINAAYANRFFMQVSN